jgi:osmotically-inducible protein OsmY
MAQFPIAVMKFRFGATVVATDGEAADITGVVVLPGQRTLASVVVKLPGGTQVAVPLERIADATAAAMHVTGTREALLQAMPKIPEGATVLSSRTRVAVNGSNYGNLAQISMVVATGAIHHLTVRHGLSGEYLIPASAINDISDDGRAVACVLANGAAPVAYRSDGEVANDAQTALWNYARLRVDLRAVQVRVVDGEVWLNGYVSSSLNRRVAAELLEDVKGVTAIHNELIADNDLAIQIAQALAKDPRTHGQRFGVYPNLGQVYLRGLARSPEAALAAAEIAAQIDGHHTVVNQVAISHTGEFLPMLAPVTGTEDVIPGGD